MTYPFREIEAKWRERWRRDRIFEADPDDSKKKVFVTFPFPYVNGPLHLGHAYSAIRLDVYARFKRMQGYNVLYPWAWHWTGEPIAGMAKRVANGDEAMIRMLREIDGVPDEEIRKFTDPVYIARYYTERGRRDLPLLGLSIDWRREFTTTSFNPGFSRFVEWQYRKLREKGYLTKSTHPVIWCPRDKSPTGDHDRLVGEGVRVERFYVVKFPFDDGFLPAATFRPETIFGATNIWVHPDATYVWAEVDGERWLVSERTVLKLREQNHRVRVLTKLKGREILGRSATNPLTGAALPVLPAWFVDPDAGTGVVFSVPAHAPYDWLALRDLKRSPEKLAKYGVDPSILEGIKPISIIRVEGFGEYPALEIVDRLGVRDQGDEKAERATKEIYKAEFHRGVMKDNCGRYAGLNVSVAKERIAADMESMGYLAYLYDTPEPVICRCGTRTIVKILKDQWFIRYSDENWKRRAKKHFARMRIYPEEVRNWFLSVVDWLEDKPFTRRSGLGTPLPWDKGWIIESLSDSTIYMAFYTISKFINMGKLDPEKLNDDFFDYVLLGEKSLDEAHRSTGIDREVLREVRREFTYWYPVDMRSSGKDLVPNHLTFFVFHHIALFPEGLWPQGISVNGFVMIEGGPLSKRAGRILSIRDSVERFGADTVRFYLISAAEGLDDPNWVSSKAEEVRETLSRFYEYVRRLTGLCGRGDEKPIDRWLNSRLQRRVGAVTRHIEEMRLRTALIEAFYKMWNDLRWYERRGGCNGGTINRYVRAWIKLLSPFIPHMAEELWHELGNEGYVSTSEWPEVDEELISPIDEVREEEVTGLLGDIKNVMDVLGIEKPRLVAIYLPARWKYEVARMIREELEGGSRPGGVLPKLMKNPAVRRHGRDAAEFIKRYVKTYWDLKEEFKAQLGEAEEIDRQAAEVVAEILSGEMGVEARVYREGEDAYDPRGRAGRALPFKPAIYIE